MKKFIIIVLLIILPVKSFSQEQIGIFAGINGVTLSDGFAKRFTIFSNSFTYHFGGSYEKQLSEKISFNPKIEFSKQGDLENLKNIHYETSYLNIPLVFNFFKKPYIIFGPKVGVLLNTKKRDLDYGDLETIDYGLNLGVGIDIKQFFVELNIYQGLNELIYVNLKPNGDRSITNTVAQFSIGYNFDL